MNFVRVYGRLFVTFICNPQWDEIQNLLLSEQTTLHYHITAYVFNQKLKSLIDLKAKYHVFQNVGVDEINFKIQVTLPGELISFKSIDPVINGK